MRTGIFSILRREVLNIRKATAAGTGSFEIHAKLHGSEIYTCRYNEIGYIWCDTMAVKDGKTIITEQNLQYFPAKVRYFITASNK
jgi:hypothetical protein